MIKFGSVLAATTTGASFFNTDVFAWSAGPRFAVTPVDSITFLFRQSLWSQTQSTGDVRTVKTNTQSLVANYTRVLPDWRFTFGAGAVLIEPSSKAFVTGRMTISTNPERSTSVQLDLSRLATPSIYVLSGALISNVGQVQITHLFSERLSLQGSVNYALNESVPKGLVEFKNFTVTGGLTYKLTRDIVAELFFSHNDFAVSQTTTDYTILRNVVGLALTAQWQ